MQTWLKMIGSSQTPIAEWRKEHIGFRKQSIPSIRTGDEIFLYAPGGSKRIFALAVATSDPESDPTYDHRIEGSCCRRIQVKYKVNLPVSNGIHISQICTGNRNLTVSDHWKTYLFELRHMNCIRSNIILVEDE